jgi:prevent-host-death family protein
MIPKLPLTKKVIGQTNQKNQIDHFSGQIYRPPVKAAKLPGQSVPLTEAKAHLAEYVRAVENGEPSISITRHGKVVAKLIGPEEVETPPRTLASYMGSLRGTITYAADYDEDEPTWADDEWDMHKDEEES